MAFVRKIAHFVGTTALIAPLVRACVLELGLAFLFFERSLSSAGSIACLSVQTSLIFTTLSGIVQRFSSHRFCLKFMQKTRRI